MLPLFLDIPAIVAQASELQYPLAKRAIVSSPYGPRTHPIDGGRRFHRGTDFAAPQGSTILAAHDGIVKIAQSYGTFGNTVIVESEDFQTLYAHAHRILVVKGQEVRAGDAIAEVGSTGFSTGPHLHIEVRRRMGDAWTLVNPCTLIKC
ncbi:peptidase M23 domain-containing protein [Leptolyngbya boryana NIES-2135]|jgi:murein DD-endopeptidase MepM/ murein hydrolase activator NlpD|uniref:Peptidase M23 domain-containing protein n=1 Tax=Leptolyngbya boryana NIES-2135 TaxID=1973484 RepID=A0A1Z4JP55_LEPBY|nr:MULTISPECIES: M23 family metallopeptidase [Leptolyngbya]BAY58504.1 peptidase M23 domain-containing protein [Leptolyngbya boryana NIES-2135]MBD2370978.1 M23 family metallopeptidase [Leptolyngbya sp. FACHB-161]MBD2377492.1 M23 family metallopeptidase [Leptolyngbya sp. FACHB-238]MBD2401901.1 M23 family metallopeptidase [Leptolyngbya sp. FACHB-239]MBD2408418.1 M23 family metallopeptidase [Leptolyngbya sp. FACHB-402]